MYAKPLQIVQSFYSKPKGHVITGGIYVFYNMYMYVNTIGNNLRCHNDYYCSDLVCKLNNSKYTYITPPIQMYARI